MRRGFTLLEVVFVIVIMGILAKFGTELLYKTYENYVYSNTFNRLENQSEMAVKQIANRLQYRIKDSTIARDTPGAAPEPIGSNTGNELVLEWIGADIDGWRSTTLPEWSGFIDLMDSNATQLATPGSQYVGVDGALFFIGSDVDLSSNFGWGAGGIGVQSAAMHPVTFTAGPLIVPKAGTGDFSSSVGGVYEFYQFSRSAYAISLEAGNKLYFYHDYKPWDGESMTTAAAAGNKQLIMEDVKTFHFTSLGDILVVQVCVSDKDITGEGEYSICKEKVVF
ncbi:type II secretion system protein [Sulfurovum sp.]|uniref:type II secretion system protein n=1 Tax=Sulfurovum sp. TaxID=1969726 RepID=UPI003564B0F5